MMKNLHNATPAVLRACVDAMLLEAVDNGAISATAAEYAIRNMGPSVDLENDLHPFGHGEEREFSIWHARVAGDASVSLVAQAVRMYCDEEFRADMEEGFCAKQRGNEGPHADDVDDVLPDPMDKDAVY